MNISSSKMLKDFVLNKLKSRGKSKKLLKGKDMKMKKDNAKKLKDYNKLKSRKDSDNKLKPSV